MLKNKNGLKNIVIILLLGVILSYTLYMLLKPNLVIDKSNFLKTLVETQKQMSLYIGELQSDTFNTYTTVELFTAMTMEGNSIKNNNNEDMISIVDNEPKIIDNINYYCIDTENFFKITNYSMPEIEGLSFYTDINGNIKVYYLEEPSWWQQEYESFLISDNQINIYNN